MKNLFYNTKIQPKFLGLYFLTIFILMQLGNLLKAQSPYNLVPNYSFENYVHCPTLLGDAKPPPPWRVPLNYTGVYWNSCSSTQYFSVPSNQTIGGVSYQYANTGNGYIGLFFRNLVGADKRNYIHIKLKDSLVVGGCYYAEFYVSLINSMKGGCNNISIAISNNIIWTDTINNPYDVIPFSAQIYNYGNPVITDTMNWVKVSSIYLAQGGEKYITIGNFKYDTATQYQTIQASGYGAAGYYVDDIQLIPLDMEPAYADAYAGDDITIAQGDSVFVGSFVNGITNIAWYNSTGQKIDSVAPGFWVKPTSSTYYVLRQTVCGNYSTDTIFVTVGTVPLRMLSYELRMMNERQIQNNWTTANEINVSHFNIQRSVNGRDFTTIGQVKANNKNYNEYSFTDNLQGFQIPPLEGGEAVFYKIESVDRDGKKQYSTTKQITIKPQTPNNVFVYPNPAKDVVNIVGDNIQQIIISTIEGKKILSSKLKKVNIESLEKGIYIISIFTTNGNINNKKLMIE